LFLIAGLGNPGLKYRHTRHNVGFMAADYIAEQNKIKINKIKFRAVLGEGKIGSEKVILVKPQTFMNNSGESIAEISRYYKIPPQRIIVIYDDAAINVGRVRIRPSGSDGGHNGMKSVIYHLNSDEFPRVKIGIGSAQHSMIDFVLGKFDENEGKIVTKCIKATEDIVKLIIVEGCSAAMNNFNGMDFTE